jgi:hypothetical protein
MLELALEATDAPNPTILHPITLGHRDFGDDADAGPRYQTKICGTDGLRQNSRTLLA